MGTSDVSESHSTIEHGKPGALQNHNVYVSVTGSYISYSLDPSSNLCSCIPPKKTNSAGHRVYQVVGSLITTNKETRIYSSGKA